MIPPILRLSNELLDEIIILLPDITDIIALAEADTKNLLPKILPRHLERIRCDPYRLSVWRQLHRSPAACKRIRKIEFVPEIGPQKTQLPVVLPRFIVEDSSNLQAINVMERSTALTTIAELLPSLINLSRFSWSDQRPRKQEDILPVFEALKKDSIRELQIDFYGTNGRFCQLAPVSVVSEFVDVILIGNSSV